VKNVYACPPSCFALRRGKKGFGAAAFTRCATDGFVLACPPSLLRNFGVAGRAVANAAVAARLRPLGYVAAAFAHSRSRRLVTPAGIDQKCSLPRISDPSGVRAASAARDVQNSPPDCFVNPLSRVPMFSRINMKQKKPPKWAAFLFHGDPGGT